MRILFAEDDRSLRTAVARGLREAAYTVEQAATGTQALTLAVANEYDVIILDILLPGKSGLEVCAALREQGNRVPILLLTALDAVEQRIAGLDAGADDYLTKPFDFGELLARLRALTRRGAEPAPPTIAIDDLVIDVGRRAVRRGPRDIELTAKEFDFLLYLARHAGRAVTRAELVEHVWDDTTSYSNIIDVYASRLRHKIDEGEDVALFSTLRGVGFILEAPPPSAKKPKRPTQQKTARRR
jgi:DNA-binding response OmpR family regulator